jgi:TPR repeat protein
LKAAEQDDVVAQFFVANLYENGQGVTADLVQAYKWLSVAEGGNHPDAKKTAAERKGRVAGIMTKEQIADAEKQAREWVAKNRR